MSACESCGQEGNWLPLGQFDAICTKCGGDSVEFCWCDMCGFNRKMRAITESAVATIQCPDCDEAGDFCFLKIGDALPDHIIPDDPMEAWKP